MSYCCERMAQQMRHACETHLDPADCPDSLVAQAGDTGEFGIRIHDGGSSTVTIHYCPWCGKHLSDLLLDGALGPPSLRIRAFQLWVHDRAFPDASTPFDADVLRVTAHAGEAGASVWVRGAILMVTDIMDFGEQCRALYDRKAVRAVLEPLEPDLRVVMETIDRAGHLRARVSITPDHMSQRHEFDFDLDQSYLPEIIDQCATIVSTFPPRGR